ncbi:SNXAA protein, partial [Atractosteus spatula]|nr:SNXAA protein [Atractosteus spatula]
MMDVFDNHVKKEFVSIWVRDPRIQKEDFWHSYMDYEIGLHTNSMCFQRKTSCVRRRHREFVWLRQRLQDNALLIKLPELPPRNLFFSMTNKQHVTERMKGLQHFLEEVLQNAVLLSDSRLHLFLQSQLSTEKIEACASGQSTYTVAEAIQKYSCLNRRFPLEEEEYKDKCKPYSDSDCESFSSGLGHCSDDSAPRECTKPGQAELFSSLSESPSEAQKVLP